MVFKNNFINCKGDNEMIKRVLISVLDKIGVIIFAVGLVVNGFEIIFIGGIRIVLEEVGVLIFVIDDIIGFLEMLDGCVKMLYLNIYGGFLVKRGN